MRSHSQGNKQSTDANSEMTQMLGLSGRELKAATTTALSEQKESRLMMRREPISE